MTTKEDWNEGLLDSGSKCRIWHPIWLVAEGYGICSTGGQVFTPWAFTRPVFPWHPCQIIGRDGKDIWAWVGGDVMTKDEAVAVIQADMSAHRERPFDEAVERARLMPV